VKINKVHLSYSYTMIMTLKLRDQAFLDLTDIQNCDFRYVLYMLLKVAVAPHPLPAILNVV